MAFKIVLHSRFEQELDGILDLFINEYCSKKAAARLKKRVSERISLISEQPYMYRIYPNEKAALKGYRAAAVDNFLIFYRVDEAGKTVHILRFVYGKRNMTGVI